MSVERFFPIYEQEGIGTVVKMPSDARSLRISPDGRQVISSDQVTTITAPLVLTYEVFSEAKKPAPDRIYLGQDAAGVTYYRALYGTLLMVDEERRGRTRDEQA